MEKTKATYSTALPGRGPDWPDVSPAVESDIIRLLLPLLRPLGDRRRTRAPRSKGKGRRKKQKVAHGIEPIEVAEALQEVSNLTVGFNSTVRNLENLARESSPPSCPRIGESDAYTAKYFKVAISFACPASLAPPTLNSLPLLVTRASPASNASEPIRLVKISAQGEAAISHALAVPRVGVLALGEEYPAAETQALIQYVQTAVKPIEASQLLGGFRMSYLPLKLNAVDMAVGAKGVRKRKSSDVEDNS